MYHSGVMGIREIDQEKTVYNKEVSLLSTYLQGEV